MGDAEQSAWVDVPDADVATQIQNLLQMYALWVDAGRRDDIATLFTDDAEWDGSELGYGSATGAAQIATHLAAFIDPTKPMMHMPGPAVLTATSPTEVGATSWSQAVRWVDGGFVPTIFWTYEDIVRFEVGHGWRFARRRLRRRFPDPA